MAAAVNQFGSTCGMFIRKEVFFQGRIPLFQEFLLKNQLHQQHVAYRAARNGQQDLPFPQVQRNDKNDGNQLRDAVAAGEERNMLQTIDYQHAENGRRQGLP